MAQETLNNRILLSDLILQEYEAGKAFTRDAANVTPAEGLKIGTLVARDKGLDLEAEWTKAEAADFVETKELAILIGDAFSYESDITLLPIVKGQPNAVVLARDAVVAEWVVEGVGKLNGLTEEDLAKAYAMLAEKQILVGKSYGKAPEL